MSRAKKAKREKIASTSIRVSVKRRAEGIGPRLTPPMSTTDIVSIGASKYLDELEGLIAVTTTGGRSESRTSKKAVIKVSAPPTQER
jgi:hypothetical protein